MQKSGTRENKKFRDNLGTNQMTDKIMKYGQQEVKKIVVAKSKGSSAGLISCSIADTYRRKPEIIMERVIAQSNNIYYHSIFGCSKVISYQLAFIVGCRMCYIDTEKKTWNRHLHIHVKVNF